MEFKRNPYRNGNNPIDSFDRFDSIFEVGRKEYLESCSHSNTIWRFLIRPPILAFQILNLVTLIVILILMIA